MKTTLPSLTERKCNSDWLKTPYPNPIRYKSTGTYFGRVRINRKSIRRSLETIPAGRLGTNPSAATFGRSCQSDADQLKRVWANEIRLRL